MKRVKVLSLGGSIINNGNFDSKFISDFKNLILKFVKKDFKFLIVCGGGIIAKSYQEYLKNFTRANESLDWIGIYATYLNARFLQLVFGNNADKKLILSLAGRIKFKKSITLGAGTKPGFSTDYNAIYFAKKLKTNEMINLTNIDYIYKLDDNNQKISQNKLSWQEYLEILKSQESDKWSPKISVPIDPVAARFARLNKIKCIVCNGKNLDNLHDILIGKLDFKGTLIK